MDDLIELIVRGIIKWMSAPKTQRPGPAPLTRKSAPAAPPAAEPEHLAKLPPAWQEQLRQVMLAGQPVRKGKGRRPVAPPAQAKQTATIVQPVAPAAAVPMVARASTRQGATSVTASLHRQLTPRALREQYILTEIFQPPPAMRDHR